MQKLTGFLEALSEESERLGLRMPKSRSCNSSTPWNVVCSVVSCGDEEVEVVSVFPYLGNRISDDGSITVEIEHCLGLAWGATLSLGDQNWCLKYFS